MKSEPTSNLELRELYSKFDFINTMLNIMNVVFWFIILPILCYIVFFTDVHLMLPEGLNDFLQAIANKGKRQNPNHPNAIKLDGLMFIVAVTLGFCIIEIAIKWFVRKPIATDIEHYEYNERLKRKYNGKSGTDECEMPTFLKMPTEISKQLEELERQIEEEKKHE